MGLLDLASGASVWRGYEYYKDGSVLLKRKSPTTNIAVLCVVAEISIMMSLLISNIRENLIAIVRMPMENELFASIRLHCIFGFSGRGGSVLQRSY